MGRMIVTGAAGFIGSHLAEECLRQGHEVVGIDAMATYYDPMLKRANTRRLEDFSKWTFLESDLVDADLNSILEGVDTVFHLAAQPGVRASWGTTFDTYVRSNVVALQRLLEACEETPPHRFVFASSSSVYGNASEMPTSEEARLAPISPYGATKAFGENLCSLYHGNHGVSCVTLRYFTVYGPRQRPDMAFTRLLHAAIADEEIRVYGDGEQTRDFTYVGDAVAGTLAAAKKGVPGRAYNLGGGARASINEVIAIVSELTGRQLKLRRQAEQAGDARDTAADTTRAREELGFAPSATLRSGLREQLDWLEDAEARLGVRFAEPGLGLAT